MLVSKALFFLHFKCCSYYLNSGTINNMSYSEYEHRHNFSIWAAARAAQRGLTSVKNLRDALEQSDIEIFVNNPSSESTFKAQHKEWCKSICKYLDKKGVQNVSYGRAAKLVNVYLKGMLVLNDLSGDPAKFIHPPIDRILLQNVAKIPTIGTEEKKKLQTTNWTQLQEDDYFQLIDILKDINGDRPFWQIEKYWTVTHSYD